MKHTILILLFTSVLSTFSAKAETYMIDNCDVFKVAHDELLKVIPDINKRHPDNKLVIGKSIMHVYEVVFAPPNGTQGKEYGVTVHSKTCRMIDIYVYSH